MAHPVCVWDFTMPKNAIDLVGLKRWLCNNTKKWCFQEEKSETGYEHYQGRFSLKVKKRLTTLAKMIPHKMHISITSNENRDNTFYVTKDETRVNGPWRDEDGFSYIPWDIDGITLRPWQQTIADMANIREPRKVDCLIDLTGNIGKTILQRYLGIHKIGRTIPYCNSFKDIMRMAMDMPESKLYMIDLPRAISKENLHGMFSAIEVLKSGYAYDDRYSFKERYFNPPRVFVTTNQIPDRRMLSLDRWQLWKIADNELVPYYSEE